MYGKKDWFFPDAELPPKGTNPDLPGHESIIILNPNDGDAEVEIVLHWTDREPTPLPVQTVGAGRVSCVRCMARAKSSCDIMSMILSAIALTLS